MTMQEILEAMKGLSETERKELVASSPELKEALAPAPAAAAVAPIEVAELAKTVAALKVAAEADKKAMAEKLALLEKDNTRLVNQVDAFQVKTKEQEKSALVESTLKASKLKPAHITETFKGQLLRVEDIKIGDKVTTAAEQMKQLIEDREKICVAETAAIDQPGVASGADVAVEEQHKLFCLNIFGVDPGETKKKKDEEEVEA